MSKLQRNLKNNNGSWYFQKRVPKKLLGHPQLRGKKQILRKLDTKEKPPSISSTTLAALERTREEINSWLKLLLDQNREQVDLAQLRRAAIAYLEQHKLRPGLRYISDELPPTQAEMLELAVEHRIDTSGAFDAYEHELNKLEYEGEPHLFNAEIDPVIEMAWVLINEPPKQGRGKLFSECWEIWAANRPAGRPDPNDSNTKKSISRWQLFIEVNGDLLLDQNSAQQGLTKYVEHRNRAIESGEIKGSTVKRETNLIRAILRAAAKSEGFELNLTTPNILNSTKHYSKQRRSVDEASLLELHDLLSSTDKIPAWKELCMLLMMQSSAHQKELLSLRNEKLHLDGDWPYLEISRTLEDNKIVDTVKTDSRERIIPVVYKLDRIKELIGITQDDLYVFGDIRNKESGNLNNQLNNLLKSLLPKEKHGKLTTYSFRHSFKERCIRANVNPQLTYMLGGWTGLNAIAENYGKAADYQKELFEASLAINQLLIQQLT